MRILLCLFTFVSLASAQQMDEEFARLVKEWTTKPEFTDLFMMIGRLGRSLGVHLLLASQRFEEGRVQKRGITLFCFGWSGRVVGALHRAGIGTVGELLKRTAHDLTSLKGFGRSCLVEVREALAGYGLHLRGDES